MRTHRRTDLWRVPLLIGAFAFVAAVAGCGGFPSEPDPQSRAVADQVAYEIGDYKRTNGLNAELDADVGLLARVYDRVRHDYVREVNESELIQAALDGVQEAYPNPGEASDLVLVQTAVQSMLQSLDPYSVYLDQKALTAVRQETRGAFGGLGVEVTKEDGAIKVMSPLDDTPASRAGLVAGDRITHADGKSLADLSLGEAVRLLRGQPGDPVTLTIEREDTPVFDVTIVREIIRIQVVRWRTEGTVGYVRIAAFSRNASSELRDAVREIKDELGPSLTGFIIDLRNNPGGLLDQSVQISDHFLNRGLIVYTRGRGETLDFFARTGDVTGGLPVVVLINGGSASASEIVAGALQDHGRAVLVGDKTFGKGSVQTIFELGTGDGVKLTTALYYTPAGRTVDGGIVPDTIVASDPDREGDEQLDAALKTVERLAASSPRVGMVPTNDNDPRAILGWGSAANQ